MIALVLRTTEFVFYHLLLSLVDRVSRLNLAVRQQLALLRRRSKRPRVGPLDRVFWMWLSQRWA